MDRYWLWVGARLIVAAVIVGWAVSALMPGSGEKEFQKTLDAMKQVHSFRVAFAGSPGANLHNEFLWEIDCDRDLAHFQQRIVQKATDPPLETNRDEVHAGGRDYERKPDGSWTQGQYVTSGSARQFCTNLAQGDDSNVLPQIATMIHRGIIQKGDKKTVNGVRCREWLVTMKGGYRGLEHDTVCIGLDDHLPYELTVDWENSRTSYSDYNNSIRFDLPEAAVQPASATGSN
ncbi:MAG TPA: hypothetical protein VMH04_16310 [Candidatus Solibacter sp.]|nr:hypothetical protein [Candidatus Solibacter sp.]